MNSTTQSASCDAASTQVSTQFLEVLPPGPNAAERRSPAREPVWLCAPGQVVARIITTSDLRGPLTLSLRLLTGGAEFIVCDAHNKTIGTLFANATNSHDMVRQLQLVRT